MGGGTNQADHAAFHIRQQDVLLSFIKAMDFIDKHQGGTSGIGQPVGGQGEHAADISHIRFDTAQPFKTRLCLEGDDLGQRGFACARRTVENQGLKTIRLNGASQQLSRSQDMGLPRDFIEGARAHPSRQGGGSAVDGLADSLRFRRFRWWSRVKQIVRRHDGSVAGKGCKTNLKEQTDDIKNPTVMPCVTVPLNVV